LAGLSRLADVWELAAVQEHTSLGQRKISRQNLASRQTFRSSAAFKHVFRAESGVYVA